MKKVLLTITAFFAIALTSSLSAQVLSLTFNGSSLSGSISGASLQTNPGGNIGWTSTTSYGTKIATFTIDNSVLAGNTITIWNNGGTLAFKYEGNNPSAILGTLPNFDATLTYTAPSVGIFDIGNYTLYNGGTYAETHPTSGASTLVVSAIPEPSTYAAILGGLALLGLGIRRKYIQKKQ